MSNMSNYYLEHYGVIGMKWGKRRASSDSSGGSNNSPNGRRNSIDVSKTREGLQLSNKLVTDKSQKIKKVKDAKQVKDLSEKAKTMSESDLRKLSDRMSLEQRYVNLMKQADISGGKSTLEKSLDAIGTVTTAASTALAVYEIMQKFK